MVDHQKRKILHIDMDAFYASVEQRDNPKLKGKPIAVGGGGHRGVTTTASYEARKFGVKSAMPGFKAKQLCPDIIFVKPRFDAYQQASTEIREIFKSHTDLIEPLSLDEAFLDVTENKQQIQYGMEVAKRIMDEVFQKTQLTCSAGVSYCKFLAKIASDYKKPFGLTIIRPHEAEDFIEKLPVQKFFGVGKVTAAKMERMGIQTGLDLKKYSKFELAQRFGKSGRFFYDIVRGIDNRPVQAHQIRKSLAVERTLNNDMDSMEEIENLLWHLVDTFYDRLKRKENFGRTLTLKLKTSDFKIITKSLSKEFYIRDKDMIGQLAIQLLREKQDAFEKIRLIGLTASNLEKEQTALHNAQLSFDWDEDQASKLS